jgi:hypothetical protein
MGDISTLKIVDLSGNSHLKTGNIFDIFQNFSTPIFITTQPSVSVTENYLTLAVPMPSAIPSNISKMKNLEILYIADNYLRDLPQNTKFPASLKELYMQGNVFTVLPESIGELRELTVLNLKKNNLETLPASFGNLKKLKQLEIEDNSLTSLPASFFDLTVSNSINYTVLVKEATNKNNLNLVNQIYEGIKNKKKLDNADYGSLSWWFFFAHNFDAAIWAGERYESEGGESVFLLSNLAMGYLYKGEYEKALEIYKKYKNTNLDSYGSDIKTGKDVFLKDLKEAEEKKIKPKKPADVRKILFFLNE